MGNTSEIKPHKTLRGHTGRVRGVAHLPDGRRIITCSEDGSLRLWDREIGAQIGNDWREDGDEAEVWTMVLSPNGKTVASGSTNGTVRLWDIEMRKVTVKWTGHTEYVWSVCWSPDGGRVASGSENGTVRVWEVESGETVLGTIKTGHDYVNAVVYSPDGSRIAIGGSDEDAISIWNARTGELLSRLKKRSYVFSLAWTSDQKKLIASAGNSLIIFNTTTWEQSTILEGHTRTVHTISLFQNDRLLASSSWDQTARLWNLDTNLPLGPPLQHQDWVQDVALSRDGQFLVTVCDDNNAYVWDIHTILEDAGLGDPLSVKNVKSILDSDATPRTMEVEVPRSLPRGFFDDGQSSTTPISPPPATAGTNPPPSATHSNPSVSTSRPDSPSSTHPRRRVLPITNFFGWIGPPSHAKEKHKQRRLNRSASNVVDVPLGQATYADYVASPEDGIRPYSLFFCLGWCWKHEKKPDLPRQVYDVDLMRAEQEDDSPEVPVHTTRFQSAQQGNIEVIAMTSQSQPEAGPSRHPLAGTLEHSYGPSRSS